MAASPTTAVGVAYRALNRAEEAHSEIRAHEDLCAERYANINASVRSIRSILAWGGTTLFGLLVALIAFLAVRLIDADAAETERLRVQVQVLERAAQAQGR